MFEFINKTMPKQKKEDYTGNREYKRYLNIGIEEELHDLKKTKDKSPENIHYLKQNKINFKINKRASQLKYRLNEGVGKAIYMIGIEDDGTADGICIDNLLESIDFLYKMADIVKATIKNIRIYKGKCENKFICTSRIEILNYIPTEFAEYD
jgi:GTPase